MGAEVFRNTVLGPDARTAFRNAVSEAQHESGHGGYTGTIAEKGDFVMIDLPEGSEPYAYARQLINDSDPRVDDKWGPAGCIEIEKGKYYFFGWASS